MKIRWLYPHLPGQTPEPALRSPRLPGPGPPAGLQSEPRERSRIPTDGHRLPSGRRVRRRPCRTTHTAAMTSERV